MPGRPTLEELLEYARRDDAFRELFEKPEYLPFISRLMPTPSDWHRLYSADWGHTTTTASPAPEAPYLSLGPFIEIQGATTSAAEPHLFFPKPRFKNHVSKPKPATLWEFLLEEDEP